MPVPFVAEAFSSEVAPGSRQENASKQESRAPFRLHRSKAPGQVGRQGLKEAADFPLSRLVWPAILAY
ncbi:hypothetical protein CVM73_35775 [Bradyrhizobium forestalis]|uniref:Uncharacterized protein n=1 Tax=Bradyrhizobium forestalis TaxID=1419263 RepID=A0A2M8QY93_9BRAD|nr:hypothetical protein CVM73_35775 [Bradyrhizobium forestalis]